MARPLLALQVMLQDQIGNKKGILAIEILIAVAIIAVTLTSVLGLATFSLSVSTLMRETTQANNIAQETMEAVRNIRDGDWNKVTNGNHGLTNAAGFWDFDGVENVINGFTRTALIEDVQRDANDDIVESGGIIDADTKKITVIVSWQEKGRTHDVKIITYLTNWQ